MFEATCYYLQQFAKGHVERDDSCNSHCLSENPYFVLCWNMNFNGWRELQIPFRLQVINVKFSIVLIENIRLKIFCKPPFAA